MIKIYVDGGTRGSRICMVDKHENKTVVKFRGGNPTNNELEYLALIYALEYINNSHRNKNITIYSDSKLIVNQVNGGWRVSTTSLTSLHEKAVSKMNDKIKLVWVRRNFNLAGHVLED